MRFTTLIISACLLMYGAAGHWPAVIAGLSVGLAVAAFRLILNALRETERQATEPPVDELAERRDRMGV